MITQQAKEKIQKELFRVFDKYLPDEIAEMAKMNFLVFPKLSFMEKYKDEEKPYIGFFDSFNSFEFSETDEGIHFWQLVRVGRYNEAKFHLHKQKKRSKINVFLTSFYLILLALPLTFSILLFSERNPFFLNFIVKYPASFSVLTFINLLLVGYQFQKIFNHLKRHL